MSTMARKSGIFHLLVVTLLLLLSSPTVLANPESPDVGALDTPAPASVFGELQGIRGAVALPAESLATDFAPAIPESESVEAGFEISDSPKSLLCDSGEHLGQRTINDSGDPGSGATPEFYFHPARRCIGGLGVC